jgi:hypothetical protein
MCLCSAFVFPTHLPHHILNRILRHMLPHLPNAQPYAMAFFKKCDCVNSSSRESPSQSVFTDRRLAALTSGRACARRATAGARGDTDGATLLTNLKKALFRRIRQSKRRCQHKSQFSESAVAAGRGGGGHQEYAECTTHVTELVHLACEGAIPLGV